MNFTLFGFSWLAYFLYHHFGGGSANSPKVADARNLDVDVGIKLPSAHNNQPIFIVPGTWASQLTVNVAPNSPAFHCLGTTRPLVLWYNASMFENHHKCFFRLMSLPAEEGVKVKQSPSLHSLRFTDYHHSLNPSLSKMPYLDKVIHMIQSKGYFNIHSAAYDFRQGIDYFEKEQFPRMVRRIENAVKTSKKKAVILCHSMGCRLSLHFLQRQSPKWKKRNIARLVSIAGAFGGSITAVRGLTTGYDLGMEKPDYLDYFRMLFHDHDSSYYLLPDPAAYSHHKVLATIDGVNYTVNDYEQLLTKLDLADKIPVLWRSMDGVKKNSTAKDHRKLVNVNRGPDVPVTCIYNDKEKTVDGVIMNTRNPWRNGLTYGLGDGTVNTEGLSVCKRWEDRINNKGEVIVKNFPGLHTNIMWGEGTLLYLMTILFNGFDIQ